MIDPTMNGGNISTNVLEVSTDHGESTPLLTTNAPLHHANKGSINFGECGPCCRTVERQPSYSERVYDSIKRNKVNVTLTVSILLGLVSGSMYGFGRYSKDLKDALELNQFELERFGILLDTGNYFGHPVTGYIYDHFGPQVACLSGAVIVFSSYGLIHLGIVHSQYFEPYRWIYDFGFFFVGFGTGLGYIAALASTTKNFRSTNRLNIAIAGVASGYALCSTLVGLSYGYLGLEEIFLFWAVLVAVVNVIGAICYTGDHNAGSEEEVKDDSTDVTDLDLTLGSGEDEKDKINTTVDTSNMTTLPQDAEDQEFSRMTNDITEVIAESKQQQRWAALCSSDFWILFSAFACCTGCGLFVINNVSTMVQSMGGEDSYAARLVIILSFSNCFGRVLIGALADRPGQSKLVLLGASSIVMAFALFLSAYATVEFAPIALLLTVTLVASAYGGSWVLAVGILSDWFGTGDFGKNYGVLAMGPALSGMLFNTASAWLYEQNIDPDAIVCTGTSCYHGAFLLTGTAAVVCTLLLCLLGYKRRHLAFKD